MPTAYLKQMARRLQTHRDLHPARIAGRYGVSEALVRNLEAKYQPEELPPLCEALEAICSGLGRSQHGCGRTLHPTRGSERRKG